MRESAPHTDIYETVKSLINFINPLCDNVYPKLDINEAVGGTIVGNFTFMRKLEIHYSIIINTENIYTVNDLVKEIERLKV